MLPYLGHLVPAEAGRASLQVVHTGTQTGRRTAVAAAVLLAEELELVLELELELEPEPAVCNN